MPEHTELELDTAIARQNVAKEGFTTFYVDQATGNDAANFLRWETAAKTIQAAIDKAESWCTIYVKAGTYVENVTVDKEGISIIGEKIDTVIIKPSTGRAILATGNKCTVESLTGIGNGVSAAICLAGKYDIGKSLIVGNQNAGGTGLSVAQYYITCDGIKISQTYKPLYGIIYESYFGELKNCVLENVTGDAIRLEEMACYWNKVHDNTIINAGAYGIHLDGMGCGYNSVYHNNFINSGTAHLYDNPPNTIDNKFFENFYDDHTVDTNNDGLCDTPYTFVTGTDYTPVSKRNGWLQESLGIDAGSAILIETTIANIFNAVNAILTLTETGATITTDGTVQTIYINDAPAGVFSPKKVLIDFSNQTATETVIIREWYRIKSGGGYIEKDNVTFAGVQTPLLKNVILEDNRFGVKVTIEKTGGTNRDYVWEAIYKI